MSAMRYIEFDSTYRDRNLYPLPSVFEISISQSGQKSKIAALDPVSDASPSLVWNSTFQEGIAANYISGIVVSPTGPPSTTGTCIFQISTSLPNGSGQNLRQVRSFYIGCNLSRDGTGAYPPTAPITCRRIIDYWPLDNQNALIQVEYSIPDSLCGLGGWYIQNPTPLNTTTPNAIIKTWIPGSNSGFEDVQRFQSYGFGGDNYYINYYVENTDTSSAYNIIGFDAVTRLATIDSSTDVDWAATPYNFAIRKDEPSEFGEIDLAQNNSLQLISYDPTNFSVNTGDIDGDFVRIRPDVGSFPPWVRPVNEERRICKFIYGSGGFANLYGPGPTYTAVCLDSNAVDAPNFYKNCILTTFTGSGGGAVFGPSAFIIRYGKGPDPVNGPCIRYVEFQNPLTINPGESWIIRTAILCDPFTFTPTSGALYELEEYTRDNANPFNWTGSLITTSEISCYEVELINLILPNTTLASGRGGRLIFYPFLYVQLEQVSATSGTNGNKGILSSNNPFAFKMLYRAIISDTPQPVSSPFIKIDGDSMVHTIKFKPTDNFRFGVYHSNGEPVKTVIDEQYSPVEANSLAQVSACFSFKKV
jgi:hypothetical protein